MDLSLWNSVINMDGLDLESEISIFEFQVRSHNHFVNLLEAKLEIEL